VAFHSVAWLTPSDDGRPREGEADFVLAHPSLGFLIIEGLSILSSVLLVESRAHLAARARPRRLLEWIARVDMFVSPGASSGPLLRRAVDDLHRHGDSRRRFSQIPQK